jgi:PAS domain S-box-containing protein
MTRASILVVEDENIVARDIRSRLERQGYDVCAVVPSGEEAVEAAGVHRPDLVLMDIMLKGEMDGIAAADIIRNRYDIPVVYLTAYLDDATIQRAKITEAFGYLLKPFEERELQITIEMALYKHTAERRIRFHASLLEQVRNAVLATDASLRILDWNRFAAELYGWPDAEVLGRSIFDIIVDAGHGDAVGEVRRSLEGRGRWEGELRARRRDGTAVATHVTMARLLNAVGGVSGYVAVSTDVSVHKRAEEALQVSEQRLAGIVESTMDAIISVNQHQRIVVFNAAAELMFQVPAAEALGSPLDRFIPQRYRGAHERHIERFGATGITNRRMGALGNVVGLRANGEEFPIEASISQLEAAGERLYTVILRDVTERFRAESALRESEERYRRFFEDDLTGAYVATADGRILDCNPSFLRILGFTSREEALAFNVFELYPEQAARAAFVRQLADQRRLVYVEKELRRRDGEPVSVVENTIGVFEEDGRLREFKGYMFNDTERKRLEDQLHQSQKMESIGTLASGIAHDFNNILNNVLGFSMQLKKHMHDPARVVKYTQNIEKSAARGAELSTQLLSFARVSKREVSPTRLGPIIDEVYSLATETFPRTIAVTRHVEPHLRTVLGDHGALYQVLLNLCVNARDAIIARDPLATGTLGLEARNVHPGERIPPLLLADDGVTSVVEIRVSDTGIGIPRHLREKIFDPFFTTKEKGRGTGLGLSVVYSIVRNHRGVMEVESEEGHGSTFRLFLPAHGDDTEAPPLPDPAAGAEGGTERILIVDDEESMQEIAREILEEHGYTVTIAGNGQAAVDLYRARPGEIDLVVLDLLMPGMDGGQTYLALKGIDPRVRAFFCTGYMPDQTITNLLHRDHLRAIQKPFNPQQFVRTVREVLDERPGPSTTTGSTP